MTDLCAACQPDATGSSMTSVSVKILEAVRRGHTECMEVLAQLEKSSLSIKSTEIDNSHQDVHLVSDLGYGYQAEGMETIADTEANLSTRGYWDDMTLAQAARRGSLDIVIRSEVDVIMYHLALWKAVSESHKHIIKYLLESGADVNIFNCLAEAVIRGDNCVCKNASEIDTQSGNIVKTLIRFGADVDLPISGHLTALMLAVDHSSLMNICKGRRDAKMAIAKSLIQAGADVNRTDQYRQTALMRIAYSGCEQMGTLLIEAGADVNKVDMYGTTALIKAAKGGNLNMAQVLIEAGADVNKTCERNQTALVYFALKLSETGLKGVRLLLRSGAKVNKGRKPSWPIQFRKNKPVWRLKEKLKSKIRRVLNAAGMNRSAKRKKMHQYHLLQCLCRMTIREHLLIVDPHQNLFIRIPQLGLPSRLAKYLLFGASLEANDERENKFLFFCKMPNLVKVNSVSQKRKRKIYRPQCFHSRLSVHGGGGRGRYVTNIHDALDLTVQPPSWT